jgi:hypothetical protein
VTVAIPISNETRVRSDGFSNSITADFPARLRANGW